ncbi:MAG: zf-HC2 domain-containing protein [Gammaproteobacteria bacterium]|jgi:anti-sigma factor (TIGR02949 family)
MSKQSDRPEIEDIDCLEAIDSLYAYLDGELGDEQSLARFKKHISHCRSCYSRSELEGVLTERIRRTGKDKMPASLKKRLRTLMDNF